MAKYLLYPVAILPEFSTFVWYSFSGAGQTHYTKAILGENAEGLRLQETAALRLYYSMAPAILKIGMYMASSMNPMVPPRKTIMNGSISAVMASTAALTSSS